MPFNFRLRYALGGVSVDARFYGLTFWRLFVLEVLVFRFDFLKI